MVHFNRTFGYRMTVFGLLCLVGVVSILLYVVYADWRSSNKQPNIVPGSVVVGGKIVCLPHKDQGGPQTLECAYGLEAVDGTYYGLEGLNQEDLISGRLTAGAKVVVHGRLHSASKDEKYAVAGNITVESVD